ncbi:MULTISPECIES: MarR family winged helix-turn-helix transcriptional regulator [Actinosynnema]|uniref:MarR family winged helix-turn-helix transcriptional regulator n=1 Tax=Actinosynnema TaxID=40566 RepID=UPI0020A41D3B|nr:MarR family transcriptional regulator [Actinosynnema pretiosum]MCP2096739.1 DNA-binding transcriptional regulator, MarR family [Actinosynnema pretiosum]
MSEHDVPAEELERFSAHARETGALTALLHGRAAERMGLSTTDEKCLGLALATDAPVTAGRIAELSGLSTGAVTGVIDRLERAGYVRRVRDPHDRRKVLVEVSGPRAGEVAALFRDGVEVLEATLRGFTREERAVVERYQLALLETIRGRVADA